MHYFKLVDLAIDGITSFTTSPLRLATYIIIGIIFFRNTNIIVWNYRGIFGKNIYRNKK